MKLNFLGGQAELLNLKFPGQIAGMKFNH